MLKFTLGLSYNHPQSSDLKSCIKKINTKMNQPRIKQRYITNSRCCLFLEAILLKLVFHLLAWHSDLFFTVLPLTTSTHNTPLKLLHKHILWQIVILYFSGKKISLMHIWGQKQILCYNINTNLLSISRVSVSWYAWLKNPPFLWLVMRSFKSIRLLFFGDSSDSSAQYAPVAPNMRISVSSGKM